MLRPRHSLQPLRFFSSTRECTINQSELPKDLPQHLDIAIIGGSAVGSAIAYHLVQALPSSVQIGVIERDYTFTRASAPLSVGGIREQFSIPQNIALGQYSFQFLQSAAEKLQLTDDPDTAPDMQLTLGGYAFLASASGKDIMLQNYQVQRQANSQVRLHTPDELVKRFPWLNPDGIALAAIGERDGWFDPWCLVLALYRKAKALGVHYLEGQVERMELNERQNRIEKIGLRAPSNQSHEITCGLVINAAGAWAGGIAALAGIWDFPVERRKRSVFVFHCPDKQVSSGDAASPLIVNPNGVYFRREGTSGNFLCGVSPPESKDSRCDSDDELDYPDYDIFNEIIWPTLAHRVPSFEAIKVINAWAGFYDYNVIDQNAILGYHPDVQNMVFANGFSGHGIQQALGVGRGITELIEHGEYRSIDLSCFEYARFRRKAPFYERNIV